MTDGEADGDRVAPHLERPAAADAATAIEAALRRGRVVSLVGECEVGGAGDAGLPPARRLAILKPDGSVVVHGRHGAGASVAFPGPDVGGIDVAAVDGALEIDVPGDDGGGRLRFERVDLLESVGLDSTAGAPVGAGLDGATGSTGATGHGAIRDRVLETPDVVEPGFTPLSTERETAAGPVDVYGRDAEGRAVVVEVKTGRAGPAAVGQLDRYVDALRRDLHAGAEVRGVLVAPSATERTRQLLAQRGYAFRALSPE